MKHVVGIVLRGVCGVRVGLKGAIDDCGGRVCLHFANLLSAILWRCWRRLRGYVTDWMVECGMYEFGVIFVQDFFRYDGLILHLLGEGALEEVEL